METNSIFFERYAALCKSKGETPNSVAREIGASSGSVTSWKNGTEPRYSTVAKVADYFCVSVDYLLGRTDDPVDYENDGDIIASIPLAYLEACNGDVRKACAMMEAVDEENLGKKAPTLTEKDRRDIARDLEALMAHLDSAGDLMFDGDPMSDEARESIRAAMKLGLEAAKVKNKERFTPKKYRKG